MKERLVSWTERALVARRPSWAQRLGLAVVRAWAPGVLECRDSFRRDFLARPRVALAAASDLDPDLVRRRHGGDEWMKSELASALDACGCAVTDLSPDVVIHLFGRAMSVPAAARKVLWIHSHPDAVDARLLERYHSVWSASASFAAELARRGFPARVLRPATAFTPVAAPRRHDVVFVGNARAGGRRPVLEALAELPARRFDVKVWGAGHRGLGGELHAGSYVEYHRLPYLYASAAVVLNDHAADMARHGFVTPRVFDVLASGGFCISDVNAGLEEVFGDTVPQYRDARHLGELIDRFLADAEGREALRRRGQEIALTHTWTARAEELLAGLGLDPPRPSGVASP